MGYTLPIYAAAAAKAALLCLVQAQRSDSARLDTLPGSADIPIHSCAPLSETMAIAVTISQPTDPLDLTRDMPVWAWVECQPAPESSLCLKGGEGLGQTLAGEPAIYAYARHILAHNLALPPETQVTVTIILPHGRSLAERTSNAAFGIVEGLALLGTRAEALPHNIDAHLETARAALRAQTASPVIVCVGSNGQQAALRLGFAPERLVLAGNWLGVMLVEAANSELDSLVLWGYHGKLVKLAAGIFQTSSHVADGRRESLAAVVAAIASDLVDVRAVLAAPTAAAAQAYLETRGLAPAVFAAVAERVSKQATRYVQKYAARSREPLTIGTVLCDRQGQIIAQDAAARAVLPRARQ